MLLWGQQQNREFRWPVEFLEHWRNYRLLKRYSASWSGKPTSCLSISKPCSTDVETVSSRAVIAPIVTVLLLLLFGVVSGVVEHPESGFFDQLTVGRLSQVLMKWMYKAGNILLKSSKMIWLGVMILVFSMWSSPLRNFLMMEQMLRPLSVPGKFRRSGKSSLLSFRLGLWGMIPVADKTDGIKMILSSCHCS